MELSLLGKSTKYSKKIVTMIHKMKKEPEPEKNLITDPTLQRILLGSWGLSLHVSWTCQISSKLPQGLT